jgi:leucyl-tRNA synthetase
MELVSENSLPVELPWVENYEPSGDGTSPLAHIPEFVNCVDSDGRLGRRETDTMGGFACSSWYFLRFTDPFNTEKAWNPGRAQYWMPVDCYVGGAEHAVMHLLYARFWTKVLYDAGLVTVKEPFQSLHNQGQVLALTPFRKPTEGERLDVGEEGILVGFAEAAEMPKDDVSWRWTRMSKSKGNVVTPDEAVAEYGADALRLYLLFRAPFDADIEWENKGMGDLGRFLTRIFRLVDQLKPKYEPAWRDHIDFQEPDDLSKKIRRLTHQTIRNVTTDIERFNFNTYVSWMMKFLNGLSDLASGKGVPPAAKGSAVDSGAEEQGLVARATGPVILAVSEALEAMVLMLVPGAPHSADELWESLGHDGFSYHAAWPRFDESLAADDTKTIAVQVNGKLRDTFEIAAGASNEEHERIAKTCEKVLPQLDGKTVRKVIVVPGKLVNIVAS